jgi:hypothetical protein
MSVTNDDAGEALTSFDVRVRRFTGH